MPASIEMNNYYFHQISASAVLIFNVLCCINRWWHLPIAGDPVMTRSPKQLLLNELLLSKTWIEENSNGTIGEYFLQTNCQMTVTFKPKSSTRHSNIQLELLCWKEQQ